MADITKLNYNGNNYNIGDSKARQNISNEFSTTTSYSTNDLIIYEGLLYKFISDHSAGAWNSSEVILTNINTEKLSDAPTDGYEYVRKNGQWAISSGGGGGGGGMSAMYYYQQTVNTATDAEIMRITDSRINTNSIVLECTFADPSCITNDVAWTSYAGYMAFTGTCVAATTANVTIGYTSNDNFSDRLMTLLWENPNPNSNFADQTISLDFSNYDFILVETKMGFSSDSTTQDEWSRYKINSSISKGSEFTIVMLLGAQASLSNANKYSKARRVSFTDSSIHFSDCISRQWNVTTANFGTGESQNCFVIPLKIYGISRYNYFEEQYDSSWHSLDANGKVIYRKVGKVVNVIMPALDIASGSASYGTLPEGYRPPTTIWEMVDTGNSMAITAAGDVSTNRSGNIAWFAANITYIGQ